MSNEKHPLIGEYMANGHYLHIFMHRYGSEISAMLILPKYNWAGLIEDVTSSWTEEAMLADSIIMANAMLSFQSNSVADALRGLEEKLGSIQRANRESARLAVVKELMSLYDKSKQTQDPGAVQDELYQKALSW
jgi:hypothetical protein